MIGQAAKRLSAACWHSVEAPTRSARMAPTTGADYVRAHEEVARMAREALGRGMELQRGGQ